MFANLLWPYRAQVVMFDWGVLRSVNAIPPVGVNIWPKELRFMIRTSESGEEAVFNMVGKSSLVRRKCPTWLVPNWISYPSFVCPGGRAITPALLNNKSRRSEEVVKEFAAAWTDANDVRSHSTKVIGALGIVALIWSIAAVALETLRAAR